MVAGDVTDPAFPAQLIKATLDAFGGFDIIVNNAGYIWDAMIQNMTDKQWYAMLDVHTTAPFRILRKASQFIREAAKNVYAMASSRHA
jgi:3-oxoacyl-[acyl-carrier protein] reductase